MATAPELLPDARSDTREGGVALESPPPDGFLWRQLAASGLGAVAEKVAAGQDLELDEVLLLSRASLPLLGNLVQLRETVLTTLRPDVPISPSAALPIDRAASLPDSPRRIGQAPADWETFCRTLIDLRGEISPIEAPVVWYPIVEQPVDQDHELEGGFSGVEVLRAIALARLVLPAEVGIWAPLATLGPKLAQVALDFGASHLGCVAPDGQAPRHPLVADPSVFDELLGSCAPTSLKEESSP